MGETTEAMTPEYRAELIGEQQFVENLVNQRANFVLVVFGLALAGAGTLENRWTQVALLGASTVVVVLLAMATSRAQWKVDIMWATLPLDHPATKTELATADEGSKARVPRGLYWAVKKSRRRYVGYVLPWLIVLFLLASVVAAACGVLVPNDPATSHLESRVNALERRESSELSELTKKMESQARQLEALRDSVAQSRAGVKAPLGPR